ncbi:hypothetical protein [Leucobacter denitrificans]|uniref:Uncharacterized protein n=1 Tax=Leucobacter denitrificans TaxID=683042 RepID=A0A7G9S5E1_9MICO|nr:hypothetical protein [Leucobacter denitrificans]QNN63066.1 hypothetical protein H9L06_01420 [Leucobacter denitrificans]
MKFSRTGLLTAVLVVAALFIGSFIAERLPASDRVMSERPFIQQARLGDTVAMRTAEVSVTGVQSASEVETLGRVAGTSGVWIVFDIVWSPVAEPGLLPNRAVVLRAADGRTFGDTQPVTNSCGPTQPGLPVSCQIPIEVSPDALEGAHLLIPAGASTEESDDVADFNLGIDKALAEELAEPDTRIVLRRTTTELP